MEARAWAFMGSRLLAVYLLVHGVYGASNAFATYRAFQMYGEVPRYLALYAWTPASALAASLFNLAACYVLWVHANWVAGLLSDQRTPPVTRSSSWPSLAYRAIGLVTLITHLPSLVYFIDLIRQPSPDPTVPGQLIAYSVLVAVSFALIIGADRFRSFITAAGPGPSEPDER